jgi:hypothetical protein
LDESPEPGQGGIILDRCTVIAETRFGLRLKLFDLRDRFVGHEPHPKVATQKIKRENTRRGVVFTIYHLRFMIVDRLLAIGYQLWATR